MTLTRAVEIMMDEIYKWMAYNISEDKKTFVVTNFANNLIHHTNNILRNTDEFKTYHRLNFTKPRNLAFDFDEEFRLLYVRWYNPENINNVSRLNEELKDYIESKRYEYFMTAPPVKQENDFTLQGTAYREPGVIENSNLLNLTKLEAFSFTN